MSALLPVLRKFCVGPYRIAIGGSYAKGTMTYCQIWVYMYSLTIFSLARSEANWSPRSPFKRQRSIHGDGKTLSLKVEPIFHSKAAVWNAGCEICNRSKTHSHPACRDRLGRSMWRGWLGGSSTMACLGMCRRVRLWTTPMDIGMLEGNRTNLSRTTAAGNPRSIHKGRLHSGRITFIAGLQSSGWTASR